LSVAAGRSCFVIASARAIAAESGLTITYNSSINPSSLLCRKSQPSNSRSPIRAKDARVVGGTGAPDLAREMEVVKYAHDRA
jgi:hypothetical protein